MAKTVRAGEDKFRNLVERITDGFIALDKNWNYVYANQRIGELVHRPAESLIGKNVWEEFPDAVGSATYEAFHQAMREQRYVSNIDYYAPLNLWQENHIYPSPEGLSVFIRDITEQKRAEQAIRESEETRRQIMNSALDAIICVNRDNQIIVWNRQAEKIFGWKAEEVLGKLLTETIIPPRFREQHIRGFARYLETGEGPLMNKLVEVTGLNRDGQEFPVELSIVSLRDRKQELLCAFIRDITERKQAQEQLSKSYEQLRELANHLQTVREKERASIAREIHDELGQQLTGLKLDVSWLHKKVPEEQREIKDKISDVLALLDDTIRTVRKIASELRPSILDDIGIVEALEWQSKEFERRSGIRTVFRSALEGLRLPDDKAIAIFRIFQESLTNVARHASATAVHSSCQERNGKLVLTISDNGQGLDPKKIENGKTLGLLGMRERAQMIGAEFEIRSESGKGTTVCVSVPI
ncbi:MAG TPA: PAS domain S-box protein [Chitinophagaceae bacterium]|nr:PAS domain S-box protein [Chitinophagaceae bacterium]